MKGKILSVLFCFMLVFGMLIVSCDNGDRPVDPNKDSTTGKTTVDFATGFPKSSKVPVQNPKTDEHGNILYDNTGNPILNPDDTDWEHVKDAEAEKFVNGKLGL
jgi:hypothetical protein